MQKKKQVKELTEQIEPTQELSKLQIDEKDLKSDTTPNAILTGGLEEIGLKRISPIDVPKYLLMHPAVPRGIEIKTNRMLKLVDYNLEHNIKINNSKHKLANECAEYCKNILINSGGPLFIKDMGKGAYGFGTSFAVLQTDLSETEVIKFEHQHEIFFGAARYPKQLKGEGINWDNIPMSERPLKAGKIKIDKATKLISKFTQLRKVSESAYNSNMVGQVYYNTKNSSSNKYKTEQSVILEPFGPEFDQSMVITLAFDKMGDEQLGISLIQFLHLTIKYLLAMERGCAQGLINYGFTRWVANTPFKSKNDMELFAQSISNINRDAVVILPEGIELKNIVPGQSDFDKVHPIYMQLIALRLGIPMTILAQVSTTSDEVLNLQKEDMYDDFIADELVLANLINDGFFKACKIKYPTLSIKELNEIVPNFVFKEPPENINLEQDRILKESLMIRNYAMSASLFAGNKGGWAGDKVVVNLISEKVKTLLCESMNLKYEPKEPTYDPAHETILPIDKQKELPKQE